MVSVNTTSTPAECCPFGKGTRATLQGTQKVRIFAPSSKFWQFSFFGPPMLASTRGYPRRLSGDRHKEFQWISAALSGDSCVAKIRSGSPEASHQTWSIFATGFEEMQDLCWNSYGSPREELDTTKRQQDSRKKRKCPQ